MNSIPSRHSNPFAACWVSPGRIPFLFNEGRSSATLVTKLRARGWWGEIVGPHGAGKSTLLATLEPHLKLERSVYRFVVEQGQRRLNASDVIAALQAPNPLLVVDGYDQLSFWQYFWLRRRIRVAGGGLLVTAHALTGLPRLATLSPNLATVRALVSRLLVECVHEITEKDVAASFSRHRGNVREILFDLYDRHERYGPSRRTPASVGSY